MSQPVAAPTQSSLLDRPGVPDLQAVKAACAAPVPVPVRYRPLLADARWAEVFPVLASCLERAVLIGAAKGRVPDPLVKPGPEGAEVTAGLAAVLGGYRDCACGDVLDRTVEGRAVAHLQALHAVAVAHGLCPPASGAAPARGHVAVGDAVADPAVAVLYASVAGVVRGLAGEWLAARFGVVPQPTSRMA